MRAIPPEVLLSWPTPNYANPVTRGNALLIVNVIFITLVIIVVGLRLYTRIAISRWFGSDDAFILLALVSTIGLTATVLLANQKYGWDRHVYDIRFNRLPSALKIAMAAKVVFTAASTFTRLSLLCFYYRLIRDSSKTWFRWAVYINAIYSIFIFITFIFLSIFQCTPVEAYWTFGAPSDACLNEGTVTLASGIITCVADFFCTVIPIPMVMNLKMPRSQRIAVAILLSLGFVVTIAGIVRTWYIYKSLIEQWDSTWYAYPLWIAAAVEIDLGVICASAPVLRPLLAKLPISISSIATRFSAKSQPSKYLSAVSNISFRGTKNKTDRSATLNSKIDSKSGGIIGREQQARNHELEDWGNGERGIRRAESQEIMLRGKDPSARTSKSEINGNRISGTTMC